MSLILDALRKLERDKDAREPGVVVVGSVPWGERRSRRSLVLAVAAAFLVLLAGGWWLARKAPAPPRQGTPGAAVPTSTTAPAPDTPPAVGHSPASAAAAPPPTPSLRQLVLPAPDAATGAPAEAPPATGRAATSDDVRLSAISQRDGRPVALINDRLVFEGDSVDGIKVLRIGEAEVEVEVRGQRRVLRF